ncbi:histidine kinase dimerization/phosphoacceptor domain -containing protein [Mesorhizobium sp. WSM2239]|uniref:histidine kinase n=2 Tax=unclassified Mesorhizobium TaxID=325217 RepID=A0AAU8DCB7_9HYPH
MISEPPATPANAPEQGSAAEELRYRLRQQQLTAEYAYFALQTHDLQTLLQEATRVCAEGLQSRMCKVMEYLPAEHQFLVRAGVGWKPGVVGQARARADTASPTGYAFKTGEPVISNHLDGESRFRTPALLVEHNVKRAINALIHGGSARFGVLEVDSPVEGRFTEADLVFVKGFANLIGVALERQRTEEALKQQERLLQDALRHQEFLTKEISHRVKNSLSIVASLLSMQSRATDDPALLQALADAQARVQTIARVHDQLWRRDDIRAVDLADYLGDLCDHIRASAPNHQLICDVASVSVPTDQAIPIGLLVNELITNAVKYAYPEGFGEVRLAVASAEQGGHLSLEVSDRGIGLPAGQDSAKSGGLGTKLISGLARRLGGEVQWQDAKPGTRFVMVFRPDNIPT